MCDGLSNMKMDDNGLKSFALSAVLICSASMINRENLSDSSWEQILLLAWVEELYVVRAARLGRPHHVPCQPAGSVHSRSRWIATIFVIEDY
jgi:hypothetical protein